MNAQKYLQLLPLNVPNKAIVYRDRITDSASRSIVKIHFPGFIRFSPLDSMYSILPSPGRKKISEEIEKIGCNLMVPAIRS